MTAAPQAPPTENVYGIAKRISLELEKLPLHTHAAVISIINTMCQHRKIVLESEMQQAQIDAQEAAMADARKAHAERQVQQEAKLARELVTESKAPRLSIVLDRSDAGLNVAEGLQRQADAAMARGDAGTANALLHDAKKIAQEVEQETAAEIKSLLDKPNDPSAADLDAVAEEKQVAEETAVAQ